MEKIKRSKIFQNDLNDNLIRNMKGIMNRITSTRVIVPMILFMQREQRKRKKRASFEK